MKIHITGGDGYIGRNIFNSLRNKHEISTTDIQSLDVLNKDLLVKYLKEDTPDILIHLAGLMGAKQSKSELYKTFSVNSFGLLNVIEATYLAGVKSLIFFSSLTVHGAHHDRNKIVNEEDNFLPAHPYATSKVIAEYLLRDYSRLLNINAVILRPTIIVGNLNGEENALNEFTKNAFNDEPIFIFGDGKHVREYLSINDLINATNYSIKFLVKNGDKNICETFIISSGEPISMTDLALRCVKIVGRGSVEHIDKNTQAFSLLSNIEKAKRQLQWEPKDDVDTMIKYTLNMLKTETNDHK